MMNTKDFYYCYSTDTDCDGKTTSVFLIKVIIDAETSEWRGYELLKPLPVEAVGDMKIENAAKISPDEGFKSKGCLETQRLPNVHIGEDQLIHLTLTPFKGKYHRTNPQRVWPAKTALFRTITVLGESTKVTSRYLTHWMTNRKFQMLDNNFTEYGYFVCDYNGAISYFSFEKMHSIGNRYGFTNAKFTANRITRLDGSPLPQIKKPDDIKMCNADNTLFISDSGTDQFEISILRNYADVFFNLRRGGFSESKIENDLSKMQLSIEALCF